MFCPRCGAVIADGAKICDSCGEPVAGKPMRRFLLPSCCLALALGALALPAVDSSRSFLVALGLCLCGGFLILGALLVLLGRPARAARHPARVAVPAVADEPETADDLFHEGLAAYDAEEDGGQNAALAFDRFSRAAALGHAEAMSYLGMFYGTGLGVERDAEAAVRWYRLAAIKGVPEAQFNLGYACLHGEGVATDEREAVGWFSRAAEAGDSEAMFELGSCFAHGRGVAADPAQAFGWYRRAAEAGSIAGQFNVASCYENGFGVERSAVAAYRWYCRAAESGDADARVAAARLAAE